MPPITPKKIRKKPAVLRTTITVQLRCRKALTSTPGRVGTVDDELAHSLLPSRQSDWAPAVSLFALLTFSPCEGFIPLYVPGVKYG